MNAKAATPFRFCSRQNLVYLTGRRARNLTELLAGLRESRRSSIYYHTHHYLEQHEFLSPEPPNDFSYWILNALQIPVLGEKMAGLDLWRFTKLGEIRDKIIEVIEDFVQSEPGWANRNVPPGMEFHFMRAKTFIFPTPYQAWNLSEFKDCLEKVSLQSIYHHMFESRLRLERDESDFSVWLKDSLSENDLARKFSQLDPYTKTLDNLRKTLVGLVDRRLEAKTNAGS